MKPLEFVSAYLPFAKQAESVTGVPAEAMLTQAALESGWGKYAPNNMFFGVKDTDGLNGNEQLITTIEYSRKSDLKFPVVISVKPVVIGGVKMFKYTIKDYFRKYETPADSFIHHGEFLRKNSRYKKAFSNKDSSLFLAEVAAAGYATDPNYNATCQSILKTIQKLIK